MFKHQALSFMIYLLTISLQARLPKEIGEDKKKKTLFETCNSIDERHNETGIPLGGFQWIWFNYYYI